MTPRRSVAAIVFAMVVLGAAPARAGFDEVVAAVEARYHVRPTTIPFLGLARIAVQVARPEGVADLQLAVFERAPSDMAAMDEILRRYAGQGFSPIVQVWSRRSGERTLIYAHPEGDDRVAMLIFHQDKSDTVLLQVVVSLDQLVAAINQPGKVAAKLR